MVLEACEEATARAIFDKWDLDFAIVGETIAEDRFPSAWRHVVADLPLSQLSSNAPEYDRPWAARLPPALRSGPARIAPIDALRALITSADHATRHGCGSSMTAGHGRHSARARPRRGVVRVHGTDKALAFTSDVTPRYVRANPFEGGKQAVAEAYRNLTPPGRSPWRHRQHEFRQPRKARNHGPALSARFRASARPARRSTCPSCRAMSACITKPTARPSCPRPQSARSG